MSDLDFTGKTAIVTGGTSGIGAATALEAAHQGAKVVLAGRREDKGEALAERIRAEGGKALFVRTDVASLEDIEALVTRTLEVFEKLDGAFNNAGITQGGLLHEVSEADFDRLFEVNVKGVWLCLREELRVMREAGAGSIVNTSSVGGYKGSSGLGAYQASKHAVVGLTRTAAHDNGPLGIRVNTVAPSVVDTPMSRDDLGDEAFDAAGFPVQTADEVAAHVAYLVSPRSRAVNGTTLLSDFGYTARSGFPA